MGRNSWITFGILAIVIISIVLVALLILVPQSSPIAVDIYDDYNSLDKSDYTYTSSKDISEEAMKETYTITSEDIQEGKSSKIYKQGNTDPFADAGGETTGGNNNSQTSSGTAGSTGNGNTTVSPYSADDK